MRKGLKVSIYAVSAVILLLFTPVLSFGDAAAAWVMLIGLFLVDVVQGMRRGR